MLNTLIEIIIAIGVTTIIVLILIGVVAILVIMRHKEDTRFLQEAEEQSLHPVRKNKKK